MRPSGGFVYLVGAGPGDPDLLTVRAARLIGEADDLVVDALVTPAIYRNVRARVIHVGKRAGRPHVAQAEIHRIMITLARAGRLVVRLKGGDPCVFGRAAEEMDALAAAGVPHGIVPGVSSALAAASAVGVSVTERGIADRLTVITGRLRGDGPAPLPRLPRYDPRQTLVVLMGLGYLPALVDDLLARGYPADLCAAAVSQATLPEQAQVLGTVCTLADAVAAAALPTPATLIFGDVVRRIEALQDIVSYEVCRVAGM